MMDSSIMTTMDPHAHHKEGGDTHGHVHTATNSHSVAGHDMKVQHNVRVLSVYG